MSALEGSSLSSAEAGGSGAFFGSAWLLAVFLTLGLDGSGGSLLLEGGWHDVGGESCDVQMGGESYRVL